MPIARDIFCFAVLLTMMFATVFSVATGVGGFMWPISSGAVLIEVAFWQFSNHPPSSASEADSVTFLVMLHSTCTSPFLGGISWIGVLDFFPWKIFSVSTSCLRSWYVGCIRVYVENNSAFSVFCYSIWVGCAVIYKWVVFLQSQLLALSAPPPGSIGPLKLWGLWLWHNIRIFILFSEVFYDYVHPILLC